MATTNVQFSLATHLLAALGCHGGHGVTSATLAICVNAEPTCVRRMLSKLAKAGVVTTSRGKHGSCSLSRPAAEISLLEIYRAVEMPEAFAIHRHPVEGRCSTGTVIKQRIGEVLEDLQGSVEARLAGRFLCDVIESSRCVCMPGKSTGKV